MNIKKYIIPNLRGKAGISCFYTCLYNIVSYNKINYSETDLFFLANGTNIVYEPETRFIATKVKDSLPYLERETSIKAYSFDRMLSMDFKNAVLDILSKNHILLFNVNTQKLKYNELYIQNSNRYHAILAYGIDLEDDKICIADVHFRDNTGKIQIYQGKTLLDDVEEAVYKYMWFDFINAKELPKNHIFRVAYKYFSIFLDGSDNGNLYHGLTALRKYVFDFKNLKSLDDNNFTSACVDINYNIKICSFNYINDFLTGFLRENSEYIKINYHNILQDLSDIRIEWEKAGLSIVRIGKTGMRQNILSYAEKCEIILKRQLEIYYGFLEILKTLI